MSLLGNTLEDDMRLIADMTVSRVQALCKATTSTTTSPMQTGSARSVCSRADSLIFVVQHSLGNKGFRTTTRTTPKSAQWQIQEFYEVGKYFCFEKLCTISCKG
jgi:hypothetical protein